MPRIVDHDQRRTEIVAAAIALIEESGPRALTMRSLAARLGVANGALDRYFTEGKAAILEAVYAEAFRRVRSELTAVVSDLEPGLGMLRAMVLSLLPVEGRAATATILLASWHELAEAPGARDRVGHDVARMRTHFEEQLRHAVERGEVTRPERIPAAALTLVTLVTGAYHLDPAWSLAGPEEFEHVVDLVLSDL